MGAFGMALAFLGTDPFSGQLRIPFSSFFAHTPLSKGLDLTATLIGLYGVSQVFAEIVNLTKQQAAPVSTKIEKIFPPFKKVRQMWKIILSSLGIGTVHQTARQYDLKRPEKRSGKKPSD